MDIVRLGYGAYTLRMVAACDLQRIHDVSEWHILPMRTVSEARAAIGHFPDCGQIASIRSFIARNDFTSTRLGGSDQDMLDRFAAMLARGVVCALMRAATVQTSTAGSPGTVRTRHPADSGEGASPQARGRPPAPTLPDQRSPPVRAGLVERPTYGSATTAPETDVPATPVPAQERDHAILCLVLDEEGERMADIEVSLKRTGGQRILGRTDSDGAVLFESLPSAAYTLCLDQLDHAAWEAILTTALNDDLREEAKARYSTWDVDRAPAAMSAVDEQVGNARCMATIAYRAGFHLSTLLEHPRNLALKSARGNPYILAPEDQVHIPLRKQRRHACAVDTAVVVRRRGVPERLRIQFLRHDFSPRPGIPYALHLRYQSGLSTRRDGATDGAGFMDESVYPEIVEARVELFDTDVPEVHQLDMAALNPLTDLCAWKQRFSKLGYHCGESAVVDPVMRQAVRRFQQDCQLLVTGLLDVQTRNKLLEISLS